MFCLDTNIIIHALNSRRPEFAARISDELRAGRPLLVPAIVRYELEYGFAKGERRAANRAILETLLARGFEQHAFDEGDATEAGDIRAALEAQGTPIGPYDILIAAQARRRSAVLVTLNRREFERVPGLMVTDWST
jgi:tRNA(fMet)-specific endonuclease VapC